MPHVKPFTADFLYWTGRATRADPAVADKSSQYELLVQDNRGDFGPRYLTTYELADERSLPELSDTQWRMLYTRLAQAGESSEETVSILAIAMDLPAGTGPDELAEFNDFYTRIHLPQVVEDSRFLRGTRYELSTAVDHPPGCPRYLAVYEADARKTADYLRAQAAGNVTAVEEPDEGPPVWRNRTTVWRVRYRLISP
ncbi:hypothetical protein [Pseudonocardia acaciae]|uniref:hypothetical protein n=1 Tax=Pseudonocardia acaciae TaxID=551276 RepID=UPI000491BC9F|nr:hypothetical protein [Pseudonocardia acaciae]